MNLLQAMEMHILSVLALLVVWPAAHACPDSCHCLDDTFVTCSDFHTLDLAMLPPSTDILALSSGEVDELPKGFLVMAKRLKLLEISKLRVRVVRQGAFRGLSNLEKISITDSTFDIVEPESFSAMTSVQEFEIISSQFGRIGKHAFSSLKNIHKFTVWLTALGTLADEAFYRMQGIESFQISSSNISYVGKDIFKGSKGVEEASIYNNHIDSMAENSLVDLFANAQRVSVHRNTFICSCDLSWILKKTELLNNVCVYPGQSFTVAERRFQLIDMTADALCTAAQEEGTSTEASTNNRHIPSREDIDYHNSRTEVAQNSQEIGHSAHGKTSDPHIFPVVETFDEDLAGIDHFLFEDILSPTSAGLNKTSREHVDESSLEHQSIIPDITKLVHDKIDVIGDVQNLENTSQSVQDIKGKNSKEIFLAGKESFVLENPVNLFDTTDSSTEDERSERFNIVGEYVEVTLAPTEQDVDLLSTTEQEVDLPMPTEQEVDLPPPTEQEVDLPPPTEQEVELPTPTEQEVDLPPPTEQEVDLPLPTEQEGDLPLPTEQEGDLPTPIEQEVDLPDPIKQEVDLSLPTEHEVVSQLHHHHPAHVPAENLTTDDMVVTWEQESVYFDQKTSLSSSENEGFESEQTEDVSYTDEHVDVDNAKDVEEEEDADGDDTNKSSAKKIVIDKMALAVSGRVNGQGQQRIYNLPKEDTPAKHANCKSVFRASLLCVLASCLFCILHWLVLV